MQNIRKINVFCVEANTLKSELYNENISFVKAKLDANPPVSKSVLDAVEQRLNKAAAYANGTSETAKYSAKLVEYKKITAKAIEEAKLTSADYVSKGDMFGAYDAVASAKVLDPKELGPLADEYGYKAIQSNMPKAEKLIAEDNMKEAKELLTKMAVIDPNNSKIKQYLEQATKSDNPDYYIAKGTEARDEGELEKALTYFKKGTGFP